MRLFKVKYLYCILVATIAFFLVTTASSQEQKNESELGTNPYPTNEITMIAELATGKILYCDNPPLQHIREYMPGSIFKIPITVALIMQKKLDTNFVYECKGFDTIAGVRHKCWSKQGHGKQNFIMAFSNSCNLYFKTVAMGLDLISIEAAIKQLGMTEPSGFLGDTNLTQKFTLDRNNILGGAFNISAAELLRLTINIASRKLQLDSQNNLADAKFEILYKALRNVVLHGTAQDKNLLRYRASGKTGTVDESMGSKRKAGWFIGYYPYNSPKYAVCTFRLNNTGHTAACIAGKKISNFMKNIRKK